MMKAIAIVIRDNNLSENGYSKLVQSSNVVGNTFTIDRIDAITPENVDHFMNNTGLIWNYPWQGEINDFVTGLKKSAYKTANPKARVACACSHYILWTKCIQENAPILVLEHDAYFTHKIDFDPNDTKADIIGINDPLGATRRAQLYRDKIQQGNRPFQPVPWVDDITIPQGLAGNSAYIIKPRGAKNLVKLVSLYGMWPNDAIMCRQLIPNLGVTKKFYTRVQGLVSTTSL